MIKDGSEKLLDDLLSDLLSVLKDHPEICDTEMRENLYDFFSKNFIYDRINNYNSEILTSTRLGLFSDEGEKKLRSILNDNVIKFMAFAAKNNLSPKERYELLYKDHELNKGKRFAVTL